MARRRRTYAHDGQFTHVSVPDLPLFGATAAPWPEAPPATDENRVLLLPQTIDGEFDAWMRSEAGVRFLAAVESDLLAQAEHSRRVSISRAWEGARAQLRVSANNDYRAPAARLFLDRLPALRGKLEVRRRRAT